MTDEELYRSYLDGDETGLAALMDQYGNALTLYIDGYLGDIHEAEDLMIEVFSYLLVKRPHIRDGGLKAYLYKAARHMALRHKRRKPVVFSLENLAEEPEARTLVEEVIKNREQSRILHLCMEHLNAGYREALYLTYFEELSYAQAAQVRGKSVKQGVTWTSSDPDVVMVDVNGTIKALKEGTATITVTTDVGQKTAVCEVTVRHTHTPVETAGKAPTCTEEGSKAYYTCSGCGKFFEDEECTKEITDLDTWKVIEPLNHSFTDYVYNNDATCTANGTETAKCDRCDETDTREKEDSMLEHNYENGTCTVCGAADPDYKPDDPVKPTDPTDSGSQTESTDKNNGQTQAGNGNHPQTGDNSNLMLWSILLAASGASVVAVAVYGRKKKKEH